MQYVMFGNTGMEVSRFSLGAMTFGNRLDRDAAERVVAEALDQGINLIDTADSYGKSEEFLGEILTSGKRERVYLATKVYTRCCRDERTGRNSRVNILNSLERSLRLLQTDYVDLYQLHHPDPKTPVEETLGTLAGLVRQGKVRYVGVSNHYAWQMAHMIGECKARNWEPLVSVQSNYNLLDRQIEREVVPFCRRFNIAVLCYGPLCGGILTGKYHGKGGTPEGSRGEKNPKVRKYLKNKTVAEIVAGLKRIARKEGLAMNQASILWLKAKPAATTILLGGSRPEHFTQVYEVMERDLPGETVKELDALSESRVYTPFANQPVGQGTELAEQM